MNAAQFGLSRSSAPIGVLVWDFYSAGRWQEETRTSLLQENSRFLTHYRCRLALRALIASNHWGLPFQEHGALVVREFNQGNPLLLGIASVTFIFSLRMPWR
jgi:hypothetical protein